MLGSGEIPVHERVVRVAVGSRACVDQHVDQFDLYATLSRNPGPRHQRECVVHLLLESRRALAPCRVDDRASHRGDVRGQPAVADGIFRHEPEQVWSVEEAVERLINPLA